MLFTLKINLFENKRIITSAGLAVTRMVNFGAANGSILMNGVNASVVIAQVDNSILETNFSALFITLIYMKKRPHLIN